MKIDDLKTTFKLLSHFNNFINNRSISFLSYSRVFLPKLLEWHFKFWRTEFELRKNEQIDKWSQYREISFQLDSIFQKVEERVLRERQSYSFFRNLEIHAENKKMESVTAETGSRYFYVDTLFGNFYRVFFDSIEQSPERHEIWNTYFPSNWKITGAKLTDTNNIIARVSWNNFIQWAQPKIWNATQIFDKDLDDVSRNLFPEADPILWARILTFALSPYEDNRVKSVIERPWNFGAFGRIRSFSGHPAESEDQSGRDISHMFRTEEAREKSNTLELAFLFGDVFDKVKVQQYIEEAGKLHYPEGSEEERKRLILLSIFQDMISP